MYTAQLNIHKANNQAIIHYALNFYRHGCKLLLLVFNNYFPFFSYSIVLQWLSSVVMATRVTPLFRLRKSLLLGCCLGSPGYVTQMNLIGYCKLRDQESHTKRYWQLIIIHFYTKISVLSTKTKKMINLIIIITIIIIIISIATRLQF